MADIHISLIAEPVATIGGFVITNAMVTSLVGSLVVLVIFYLAARRVALHPTSKLTTAIESIMEALRDLMDEVLKDTKKTTQLFPLLMTFFLFILVNNWLGLLPGIGSITTAGAHGDVPLFRGATADLNTTLALALISVVVTHAYAIKELGVFQHIKKYFSWNPIKLFIGLLELVSEVSRLISFTFRLFGNIFAGEVLLVVISFLMPLVAPVPFFFLELFVGFIQALVFTMLTLVFIGIATAHHEAQPA